MDTARDRELVVVAVVVTWNDTEMTLECVESLLQSAQDPLHIILVDNGSSTPCGAQVKERFPSIELVVLPENRGFTGGSNAGIARALELDPDYVHLIGNDSTLAPDAIPALVRTLEEHPDVGGASPLLFHPGDERIVQYYWGTVDRDVARTERFDHDVPYAGRSWPTRETGFVPFVAVLFRAKALREVGGFDEMLGTCWEDFDLILRFHDAGWRFVTVGDSEVIHKGSMTTGRESPYIVYYLIRNRLICLFRYARPRRTFRRLYFLSKTFWWQVRSYGWTNWRCHRAFARGVLHFMLGVRGEGHAPRSRDG